MDASDLNFAMYPSQVLLISDGTERLGLDVWRKTNYIVVEEELRCSDRYQIIGISSFMDAQRLRQHLLS